MQQHSSHHRPSSSLRQSIDDSQPFLSLNSESDHCETKASLIPRIPEDARDFPASPTSAKTGAVWKRAKSKVRVEVKRRQLDWEFSESSAVVSKEITIEEKPRWQLLKPTNWGVRVWNGVYLGLMMYTFLIMPYNFAFMESESQSPWLYINSLVDFLFACDVVIKLNTSFYNQSYKLATSRREVYQRYGCNWLVVDIIATVPFHFLSTQILAGRLSRLNRLIRLFRILKLFQLFRRSRGFDMMDKFDIKMSTVRFLSFLAATLVTSHLFSCLWSFIAVIEADNPASWVNVYQKENLSDLDLYVTSLHWTIQTLTSCGFGDIVPCTSLERIVGILWMSFAVLFISYTVGCLGTVLDPKNSKENVLIRNQGLIDEFAKDAQLSSDLRVQLRQAVRQKVENSDSLQHEVLSTFQDLPEEGQS